MQPRVVQKNRAISQTDAKRRFKQKPYLSCHLRFSIRHIVVVSKAFALLLPSRCCRIFSPSVGKASSVLTALQICYALCFGMLCSCDSNKTVMTYVFQSFYLSDWQGVCAFGGHQAGISAARNISALNIMPKTLS